MGIWMVKNGNTIPGCDQYWQFIVIIPNGW